MKRIALILGSAALIVVGLTISASQAKADTYQNYALAWSGQDISVLDTTLPTCGVLLVAPAICGATNNATATGTMTLDLTGFPTNVGGLPPTDISGHITALSVTVSGSADSAANGTFTLADLQSTAWNTDGATFTMGTDVLAQLMNEGIPPADFGLTFSSATLDAPSECWNLTMCTGRTNTSGKPNEPMGLTEFSPVGPPYTAVPEPGTGTLLLTGLLLLGLTTVARKRAWPRRGRQQAI